MFFEIKKSTDYSFPVHFQLTNNLVLNCDSGWQHFQTQNTNVYYKGYNDTTYTDSKFAELISNCPTPKFSGNFFAVIVNNDDSVATTNDLYRGTPLYIGKNEFLITNIQSENTSNIWADKILSVDSNLKITEVEYNPYKDIGDLSKLSDDQVINTIDSMLNEKFERFLTKNTKPIKIFLSGGIDTTTCFSYLKKFTNNYEIIAGELFQFSPFICAKKSMLDKLWGYTQIHHLREPSILVTGGNGDEEFMRGPVTANMILHAMGTDIISEVNKDPNCYHHFYFKLPGNIKKYNQQENDLEFKLLTSNWDHTVKQAFNMLVNDHQHWHLENTLTFTPLKDLRFTNLILRTSKELLKSQILDSAINKILIERNDPDLLNYISTQKNSDSQSRTWSLYQKYWANVC